MTPAIKSNQPSTQYSLKVPNSQFFALVRQNCLERLNAASDILPTCGLEGPTRHGLTNLERNRFLVPRGPPEFHTCHPATGALARRNHCAAVSPVGAQAPRSARWTWPQICPSWPRSGGPSARTSAFRQRASCRCHRAAPSNCSQVDPLQTRHLTRVTPYGPGARRTRGLGDSSTLGQAAELGMASSLNQSLPGLCACIREARSQLRPREALVHSR